MVNGPASDTLRARLIAQAQAEGFAAVGFASAGPDPVRAERLGQWIDSGQHGSMDWMANRMAERASPHGLWPDARSVIALGMSYAPQSDPLALADAGDRGRISVYAQGRDYHDTVKKALKRLARWLVAEAPGEQVKVFVDTAPVMEKPLGQAAGLGWQGKHTNLVSRAHGSWLFLGAIYTTIDFYSRQQPRRSLRIVHRVPVSMPDRCLSRTVSARCTPLHFLPDDRARRPHPARIPRGDRQPDLWL